MSWSFSKKSPRKILRLRCVTLIHTEIRKCLKCTSTLMGSSRIFAMNFVVRQSLIRRRKIPLLWLSRIWIAAAVAWKIKFVMSAGSVSVRIIPSLLTLTQRSILKWLLLLQQVRLLQLRHCTIRFHRIITAAAITN